jgi:hypothetical protein
MMFFEWNGFFKRSISSFRKFNATFPIIKFVTCFYGILFLNSIPIPCFKRIKCLS